MSSLHNRCVVEKQDIISPGLEEARGGRPILFVGNPASRSGKAAGRIERARELLNLYGLEHDFRPSLPDGRTSELVSEAIIKEGFRVVVYLGGDGTFSAVAKGICGSGKTRDVQLGMLPSGTANDQGKSFGVSSSTRSLEENVRIIAKGHTTYMDVGEVVALSDSGTVLRRDLFFDSLGWGLSAAILSFRNRELEIVKKMPVVRDMYRDQMVYVRAAMHELTLSWMHRDRFVAELEIDGQKITFDQLTDLVVSNTIIYAGDWIVDPDCKHDDGRFEIALFRGIRDWTSKLIIQHKKVPLTEEMLNKIGVSHSPTLRGSEMQIHIMRPAKDKRVPAQLDGDEFPPADTFKIRAHQRFLKLIVPRGFKWI